MEMAPQVNGGKEGPSSDHLVMLLEKQAHYKEKNKTDLIITPHTMEDSR